MATRKALAPKLYKRFLQVCEQWPVDQNRLGRDLGEHLKGNLVPRIKKSQIDVSIREPGARFSKAPLTFRVSNRNIKNKSAGPG